MGNLVRLWGKIEGDVRIPFRMEFFFQIFFSQWIAFRKLQLIVYNYQFSTENVTIKGFKSNQN